MKKKTRKRKKIRSQGGLIYFTFLGPLYQVSGPATAGFTSFPQAPVFFLGGEGVLALSELTLTPFPKFNSIIFLYKKHVGGLYV